MSSTSLFAVSGDALMPLDEALSRLEADVETRLETETVSLSQGLGRVLAQAVISGTDVPPHDNSAVDGWAFAAAHVPSDGRLRIVGRVPAGHPYSGTVGPGEAVRIFTGAPMPAGTDSVMMQEECQTQEDWVIVPTPVTSGANRRERGEDLAAGQTVLADRVRLRPQELGLAAAAGQTKLTVYRRLRVAIFSTGDEIREPGQDLPPGCIYDCNRTTVANMLRCLGAEVTDLGILPDRPEIIQAALAEASQGHDLIMTSGGVSVGEEDHVKTAVKALGSLYFWRLAIKPGRPVALGEIRDVPFIGLPGNPAAVVITFLLIARPVILRLMGLRDVGTQRYQVEAGFRFRHKPGRREWLRARVDIREGKLVAEKSAFDGSGVLSSMVWSSGLVEIPEQVAEVHPGDVLAFIPYAEVLR